MTTIGIDTNILVRLLVDDDPLQRDAVRKFGERLGKDFSGYITTTTLLELYWALRSHYGFGRIDTISALRKIIRLRGVEIEQHDVVVRAIRTVEVQNADFADALIAERALEFGCDHVATLDKKAALRIPGMELLA